jgi:hypothetical protein
MCVSSSTRLIKDRVGEASPADRLVVDALLPERLRDLRTRALVDEDRYSVRLRVLVAVQFRQRHRVTSRGPASRSAR